MITVSGLGSGLDIESLVSQLVAAERQGPEQRLDSREAIAQARLSAFGVLKGAVSGFQNAAAALDGDTFWDQLSSSSSNEDALGISVSSSASVGNYSVQVGQLAQAQALASEAFADSDTTELGSGTLTIRFGTTDYTKATDTYTGFTENTDRESVSFNIDSSNNTLQGIANTINDSDSGITASIVNDGSGYRLLLGNEFTGAENSLEIVATDDDGNNLDNSGLSRFTFHAGATHLEQTVAATDANLTINGLAITSDSNTLTDTLQGITLDLRQAGAAPLQLSVTRDTEAMLGGITAMVEEYNKLQSTLDSLAGYDASTQEGGILNGDFTTRALADRINGLLRGAAGGSGSIQLLSELGIRTQADGTLAIEGDALAQSLADDRLAVKALFSASAETTDDFVSFLSNGVETASGDYAVEITQLATRGIYTGAAVLPNFGGGGSITIDADNDQFTLNVDGLGNVDITLAPATYTDGGTLATAIQASINENDNLISLGGNVTVTYNAVGNNLLINSSTLGAGSSISFSAVDTNSAAQLGFDVGGGSNGLNVAGTIGGFAAIGDGNILTGSSGSPVTGLELQVTGTTTGPRGNVVFNRGIANQLDTLLDGYLASDGLLQSRSDGLRDQVDRIDDQREVLDRRMEAIEIQYRTRFAALDLLLTQLQSTSEYLTQQLAALPEPNSINRG